MNRETHYNIHPNNSPLTTQIAPPTLYRLSPEQFRVNLSIKAPEGPDHLHSVLVTF